MISDSVKISFYFPKALHPIKDKRKFFNLIIQRMRSDGNIKRTGYLKEKDFLKDLIGHIGNNAFTYKNLPAVQKRIIQSNIISAVKKSNKTLPHPDLPIFIFVYPWFPNKKNSFLFQGVNAFASYYTIHLFIDVNSYTKKSLQHTIAHEWNHLVFYRYHPENGFTLLTYLIMEGLAEVFREEVMGGGISPWAAALTEKEAMKRLKTLNSEILSLKDFRIYRESFWENRKYKRWTGYSIGYWLAKEFRKMNPNLSWEEIMETKPEDILKSEKKRA